MSKTKEITAVKEAKKLNKLEIKKETITDLSVLNDDQVKGGERTSITGGTVCYSNACTALQLPVASGTYTCPPR